MPVIHIEGRVNSIEFEKELTKEIKQIRAKDDLQSRVVMFDLSQLESLPDEYLQVFVRLRTSYKMKFQNYSLYIESQLNDNNLLE